MMLWPLAIALTLTAPAYTPGAFLEHDRVLSELAVAAPAEDRARIELFSGAFGRHGAYGTTASAHQPPSAEWVDAVLDVAALPWVRVEWDPAIAVRDLTKLGRSLKAVDDGAWVDLFPVDGPADSAEWHAPLAAASLRQAAPRIRIVRSVDSRHPELALRTWRPGSTDGADAAGITVDLGCPFCDGSRDVSGELSGFSGPLSESGLPPVLSRVYIASECHDCGARFPEYASLKLAAVLRSAQALGAEVVMIDARDAQVVEGSGLGLTGTSAGLCSSTVFSATYAKLLGTATSPEPTEPQPTPSAMPVDHSRWWLAAAITVSALLCTGAFVLGRRGLPSRPRGRGGRWAPAALGGLLVLAGAATIAYPYLTEAVAEPPAAPPDLPPRWLSLGEPGHAVEVCEGAFTISLPAIGVTAPVIQGASSGNLRGGPCWYAGTARPGEPSNCCIAGHRSTYTAPFKRLLEMTPGSEIILTGDGGFRREYLVAWVREVDASDGRYLAPTPIEALTLSTCHPFGLSSKRLMLRAYPGDAGTAAAHARPVDEVLTCGGALLLTDGVFGLDPTQWVSSALPVTSTPASMPPRWRQDGGLPSPDFAHDPPPLLLPSGPEEVQP
jgi:LPXTG-site transpeptidase (sortase) family protein